MGGTGTGRHFLKIGGAGHYILGLGDQRVRVLPQHPTWKGLFKPSSLRLNVLNLRPHAKVYSSDHRKKILRISKH